MFKSFYVFWLLGLTMWSSQAKLVPGEWTSKYCQQSIVELVCKNIHLTKEDLESDIVISNETQIRIQNSDIEILGDRFLSKFPKCDILDLRNVTFKLEPLHGKWNINYLGIEHCNITGVTDSNIFKSLPKLSVLRLWENDMDYKRLDANLFGENAKLKVIVIKTNGFESVNENAFDGLTNLEKVELSGFKGKLPSKLFENKPHLKTIGLYNSQLTKVPTDILPEGLTELSLRMNKINKVSAEDFKNLKSSKTLTYLNLDENGIENLDFGVFDELINLKELILDRNNLKNVSKKHFENLKHLRRLGLFGNDIENSDVEHLGAIVVYI